MVGSANARRVSQSVGGLSVLPPLTVEDERLLYPIIESGRAAAKILAQGVKDTSERRRLNRKVREGREAETMLLRATCGLVRTRVTERGYRFGDEELEAAGVEGLVNALQRFDSSRGVRFATYANYWITKMVNLAIQHQAGLSDTEMRHIMALSKLERQLKRVPTRKEVAQHLGVSSAKVSEIVHLRATYLARHHFPESLSEDVHVSYASDPEEAPYWVIDSLRRLCGEDFGAFWQWTFGAATLEHLAQERGISRQAMSKRLERCRRAVRTSSDSSRLEAWLARQ